MTQYQATCKTCGSKVSHLEQSAEVEVCDECKGKPPKGK